MIFGRKAGGWGLFTMDTIHYDFLRVYSYLVTFAVEEIVKNTYSAEMFRYICSLYVCDDFVIYITFTLCVFAWVYTQSLAGATP